MEKLTESFKNFDTKPKYFSDDDILHGPKKFVFQIYPENIKFIESLSYQEKQDFINHLISESRREITGERTYNGYFRWFKKILGFTLAVLIGIPLLLYMANISLDLTKSNYSEMQRNFEKLF